MNPQLADFLTDIYRLAPRHGGFPAKADRAIERFFAYLHAEGIEHCNFGGFELDRNDKSKLVDFSGTRLPPAFIEEFTQEMAADDYVMLKAGELSPSKPEAIFHVGEDYLDEIEAFHPAARKVQSECARHGIKDGIAIIGDTSLVPGAIDGRFFGFVFAGEKGTAQLANERFTELQIASFALLDCILPQVEASIDGFAYDLTEREREFLGALANGAQRKHIAYQFNVAMSTVDMHLAGIRRKLDSSTLAEAVAKGYRYGII